MVATAPVLKVCSACQNPLALEEFGLQRRGLYGRKSECKKCLADKEKARRAVDPVGYRAYQRKWWAEHPKTEQERSVAARKSRVWYANHREQRKQTFLSWLNQNRQTYNAVQARRRARKAAVLNTLTSAEWLETLEVFGGRCAYCLRDDLPLTMDHMVPISRGGPHTVENVVPACKPCNFKKHDRPIFSMLGRA